MGVEALVGCTEIFWKDPRFTDGREEIRIACPSRNDMEVQVFFYAGTRGLAEVHPDVEPVGVILITECNFGSLCELQQLACRFLVQSRKRSSMLKWNYHQMSAGVREEVEHYKDEFPSIQNQILDIIIAFRDFTEYAGILAFIGRYVAVAPGTPNVVHSSRQLRLFQAPEVGTSLRLLSDRYR